MSDKLKELARRLNAPNPGGVLLFTGAGFSDGATNIDTPPKPIPRARALADELCSRLGEPTGIPLDVIADEFNHRQNNDKAFLGLIRNTFSVGAAHDSHLTILNYPWRRIYTTNYDDLAELTLGLLGRVAESYTRATVPMEFAPNRNHVIHLNGYVRAVNTATVVSDFTLTLANYIDESLFSTRWATLLRHDFYLADTIVFVGYSMYDLDVSRILTLNPEITKKTFIVTQPEASRQEVLRLGRFGHVLAIGTTGLANIVKPIGESGGPKIALSALENFREIFQPEAASIRSVEKAQLEMLLERGIIDQELLWASIEDGSVDYIIDRKAIVNTALDCLSKTGKNVLLHSDAGNGRSTLLLSIAKSAITDLRFRFFLHEPKDENYNFDIEFFKSLKEPFIIAIEDFLTHEDEIELLQSQLPFARFLCTVRSSVLEVKSTDISSVAGNDFAVIDANRLEREDLTALDAILTKGAYWGDLHGATKKARLDYLERKCQSQLRSVLLGLIDSPSVREKVQSVLTEGSAFNGKTREVITLALCLTYVEERPSYYLLGELLDVDVFSMMASVENSALREFFAFRNNEMNARSSVLAEYIVRNFVPDNVLVDVICAALAKCEEAKNRRRAFREVGKKLMRFSFVEKLFRKTGNKSHKIASFYDRVGDIGFKDYNPQYWLQYAMASNAVKDFRSADRQFRTSFELARSKGRQYYTYQIDNHYARFLMESRTEVDYWSDYFDAFREADILLKNQMRSVSHGYYPYRVVITYEKFFERRSAAFSRNQLRDALTSLNELLSQIDRAAHGIRRNNIVKQARVSVSESLDIVSSLLKQKGW